MIPISQAVKSFVSHSKAPDAPWNSVRYRNMNRPEQASASAGASAAVSGPDDMVPLLQLLVQGHLLDHPVGGSLTSKAMILGGSLTSKAMILGLGLSIGWIKVASGTIGIKVRRSKLATTTN